MQTAWRSDFSSAILSTDDGDFIGWLRRDRWYENAYAEPIVAWVAQYRDVGASEPMLLTVVVDQDAADADDEARREHLLAEAENAIRTGPPTLPGPQWIPSVQRADEVDLLVEAWNAASDRVYQATKQIDSFSTDRIYIALTELLNWTVAIDDVVGTIWKKRVTDADKEVISLDVDTEIDAVIQQETAKFAAYGQTWLEPREGVFVAYRKRQQDGEPYPRWQHLLGLYRKNLDPRFFDGIRWIRGQMAHRGVIVAVDLKQWKPGAQPAWVWRPTVSIDHVTSGNATEMERLRAYDSRMAANSVLGTLNLIDELAETIEIVRRLIP